MIVIGTLGDRVYADEQSEFRCSTSQQGCTNVCFDAFSPVSHVRFWGFQIIFVSVPSVLFILYSGHKTKMKLDMEKEKAAKDKAEAKVRNAEKEKQEKEKEKEKEREKEREKDKQSKRGSVRIKEKEDIGRKDSRHSHRLVRRQTSASLLNNPVPIQSSATEDSPAAPSTGQTKLIRRPTVSKFKPRKLKKTLSYQPSGTVYSRDFKLQQRLLASNQMGEVIDEDGEEFDEGEMGEDGEFDTPKWSPKVDKD